MALCWALSPYQGTCVLDTSRDRTLSALASCFGLVFPLPGRSFLKLGVFAASTLLAGRLTPESLAAHHVILNIVGTTFMVPLGFSSAGAVTVGQAIGRGDKKAAKLTAGSPSL